MKALHDLLKLTTTDENAPDSPFEGGEGDVSVPDLTVPSMRGQPPGSVRCRPPLPRGNFMKAISDPSRGATYDENPLPGRGRRGRPRSPSARGGFESKVHNFQPTPADLRSTTPPREGIFKRGINENRSLSSRRNFLKAAAVVPAAAWTTGTLPQLFAAGTDTIRVGVIGCGNRGPDAARNAMNADEGVRLVAMADILMERIREARDMLKQKKPGQVQVDDDHCFTGFDAYKKLIECVDVVLIANAAKFHPLHMRAAIEAGKHVFVEKPHAIDPAGIKAVRAACDLARQKKLCVVSGLHSRYHPGYQETIKRVQDGAIGNIVAIEENFLRPPYVLYPRKAGLTEAEWQASNQYHFHWLCGDDVPQSLVHNVDRASWAMRDQAPVKAHGMGGRSTLHGEIYGSVFDHHGVVYEFANGVRMYAFCRTIPECYNEVSSILLGSKGRCNVVQCRIEGETNWLYDGSRNKNDAYDLEHIELFKAIRSGRPINNGDYMIRSTLIGLMGQFSCYTGKEVTWDQITSSDFCYTPKPEDCRADTEPPVKPDTAGIYPVFTPGVTKLL